MQYGGPVGQTLLLLQEKLGNVLKLPEKEFKEELFAFIFPCGRVVRFRRIGESSSTLLSYSE
jgi:hypothetical protein